MPDSCNQRIRTDHYVIPDIDLPDVQHGDIVIAREVAANMNILPVVTVEGLGDPDLFAHASEILLQDSTLRLEVQRIERIELLTPDDRPFF